MEKNKSKLSVLTNGLLKENPILVLILGTCPTLAISSTVQGSIGMGIAVIFVLVFSNTIISLLKNIIPDKVRIPCYIVVIAGLVTIVEMLIRAYAPPVYDLLGIYLPLITVNCIILGRAEMFAGKNSVVNSMLDGIGMGIGFTWAIVLIASIREILGSGTWFGIQLPIFTENPIHLLVLPAGGFFIYGMIIALVNRITRNKPVKRGCGCAGCMNAADKEEA